MGNRRKIKMDGKILTDKEMDDEDLAMQAPGSPDIDKKVRVPPLRGKKRAASSLVKHKSKI